MNARHMAAVAAAAALTLAALGCGTKSMQDQLPGAIYAAKTIQVYKSAVLTNMMGNETYGDEPDSHMQGQFWTFEVKDSRDKVMAFYEKLYPNAPHTTNEDGSVTMRIVPDGAEPNEYTYVTVRDGEITIGEHCKPGKIRS